MDRSPDVVLTLTLLTLVFVFHAGLYCGWWIGIPRLSRRERVLARFPAIRDRMRSRSPFV